MADLIAKTAGYGLLPLSIGRVDLTEIEAGRLTSLAPFSGKDKALSEVLKAAHGVVLPKANRSSGKDGARAIWFGMSHVLLVGPLADKTLTEHAMMTDQSDAWTIVQLSGEGAVDVLARLVPVDLRAPVFKRGHTVRTDLMHMNASITCTGTNTFMIMVFRSMAGTLVDDLITAMEGVAARG